MAYIRNIEDSANILLAHFHVKYQRDRIFSSDFSMGERAVYPILSDEAKDLVISLRTVIPETGKAGPNDQIRKSLIDFLLDRHMGRFANPQEFQGNAWFTGQMFVSNWEPAPSIVDHFS
jgi:hypothetical protein